MGTTAWYLLIFRPHFALVIYTICHLKRNRENISFKTSLITDDSRMSWLEYLWVGIIKCLLSLILFSLSDIAVYMSDVRVKIDLYLKRIKN